MHMFYKNPLINQKLIDDVSSLMNKNGSEQNRLSPVFLEEAKKASIAIGFCCTAEDISAVKKEYLRAACRKSGEVPTQKTIDEFNSIVNENTIQ